MAFNEEIIISLKDQFTASAKSITNAIDGITTATSALVGVAALGGLSVLVEKTFSDFANAEKVTTQLGFALNQIGITSKSVLTDYEEYSKALAANSEYSQIEIQNVERQFTQYGLYGDQLKKATQATLNFAAARGIGTEQAANLFIKGAEGNVEALKRYGIQVDQSVASTGGLNAIISASEGVFQGFAAAAVDTASGRMNQFKKSMDEFAISIGGVFNALEQKTGILKSVTGFVNDAADAFTRSVDPAAKVSLQINALSIELQKLKENMKTSPFGADDTYWTQDGRRIKEITSQLADLDKQLGTIQKTAQSGSTVPTKNPALILSQAGKDALDAYTKYFDQLQLAAAGTFDAIDLQRQKSLDGEKTYWDKVQSTVNHALPQYEAAVTKHNQAILDIQKNAEIQQISAIGGVISSGMNDITNFANEATKNVGSAFQGLTSNILGTIGGVVGGVAGKGLGIVGGIFSAATAGASAIQGLFSMFDDTFQTTATALSNTISQLNKDIDDAASRIDNLRNNEKAQAGGLTGTLNTDVGGFYNGENSNQALTEAGNRAGISVNFEGRGYGPAGQMNLNDLIEGWLSDGTITWTIDKNGDFTVNQAGLGDLATFREDTKKWVVWNVPYWFNNDENAVIAMCQLVLENAMKNGLDTSALGVAEADRPTATSKSGTSGTAGASGSSSGSVYTSGSTYASSGTQTIGSGSNANGNVIININAIDQTGIQRFVTDKLAPAMRYASGRQGIIFLNQQGVTSNI